MKTLNAKGKSKSQIDKQLKRWFSKNPNRKYAEVLTDSGVVTMFRSPEVELDIKKREAYFAKREEIFATIAFSLRELISKKLGFAEVLPVSQIKKSLNLLSNSEKESIFKEIDCSGWEEEIKINLEK